MDCIRPLVLGVALSPDGGWLSFLAEHLGGRYEPVGKDFQGSTIQALVGAEQVPGLVQAQKAKQAEGGPE